MSDWREKLNKLHKEFEGGYAEDKIVELEYALFEFEKEIYSKAIDDCIKAIKSIFIGTMFSTKEECNAFEWTQNKCIELAEQLKGGVENDD